MDSLLLQKVARQGWDAGLYSEWLKSFTENEWHSPSNFDGKDDYSRFCCLFEIGLVCKRTLPIWSDASHRGNAIQFLYNHQLNYANQRNNND